MTEYSFDEIAGFFSDAAVNYGVSTGFARDVGKHSFESMVKMLEKATHESDNYHISHGRDIRKRVDPESECVIFLNSLDSNVRHVVIKNNVKQYIVNLNEPSK